MRNYALMAIKTDFLCNGCTCICTGVLACGCIELIELHNQLFLFSDFFH